MAEYVFGANILENLTTGMYQDSRVIYREYIQNACDQIDAACKLGLLSDKSEGRIQIDIDSERRTITIEDNATGIPREQFRKKLANIADSDKLVGESKGFRGIGRLCGLAYCREMVFTAKYPGEDTVSVMTCDAQKMRDLISQNTHGHKCTADEVLQQIYHFSSEPWEAREEHWFRVELRDVNRESQDLLDLLEIKNYLSFAAPAPYRNTFLFRQKIYEYADSLSRPLDEYRIELNGEQVFKKYGTRFPTSKGEDEIFDLTFKNFYDPQGKLIAWMWVGLSRFKAIIDKSCAMRGIRLRKENIQIGGADALQKLFREDRGNHYFIGEVFALSPELIPNSQRDYFNENPTRLWFETELRDYFNEELHRLYHEGSTINSAFGKIDTLKQKEDAHRQKVQNGDYVDDEQQAQAAQAVEKARQEAEKARRVLDKKRAASADSVVGRILTQIEGERVKEAARKPQAPAMPIPPKEEAPSKPGYRTDKLSQYSKKERRLISRIFRIILSATDAESAEQIISEIEDELQ